MTFVENFKTYFSPRDVIVFIGLFVVVFTSFQIFEFDIKNTACTFIVMYCIYHWHVHARKQTFSEIDHEMKDLIEAKLQMKSIIEVNDVRFVTLLHDMLFFKMYNEYEFGNGVTHVNNFLRLYIDVSKRGVIYNAHHTENANIEKSKALNSFMSIMMSVPAYSSNELSQQNDILQNPIDHTLYRNVNALKHLLEEYLYKMAHITNTEWEKNKHNMSNTINLDRPAPIIYDKNNIYEVY
tara:strand:- start:192 stop:905 length:714 start_codon:yes stop_codon:yes gene_type:complete